jgi:hypothetical protein
MKFIIGKKDEFQIDENLFFLSDESVLRKVSFELKPSTTYFDKILESNYLPPELWSIIFDIMINDFLKSFNYELVAELMLISKSLLLKFYNLYIQQDLNINHTVSIPQKFSRVVGMLQTAELIYEEMYASNGVVYQIDMFNYNKKQAVPMPWDVFKVKPFISINHPIMILDLDEETIHNPTVYRISNSNAFLDGETIQSIIKPSYFRLPVLILALFDRYGNGPIVSIKLLKSSQCWKSLFDILRIGLGAGAGIYHSVNVTSLPDEYIFHNEIFIES